MDGRRNFIGKLLGIFGVAAVPIGTTAVEPKRLIIGPPRPEDFKYKGFWIYWTGWKTDSNFDLQVGQWLAYQGGPKNSSGTGRRFYASYPGSEGEFSTGQYFDISFYGRNQIPVSFSTEEKDKTMCQAECLQRLIKLIDKNF